MTASRRAERILTTHTGSLPRPDDLLAMLDTGQRDAAFDDLARRSVADVVGRQRDVGIDLLNDGESAKPSFATYVTERLGGFASQPRARELPVEAEMFPAFYTSRPFQGSVEVMTCVEALTWRGDDAVQRDIAHLTAAVGPDGVPDAFLSSASPGTVWYYQPNAHYPSHEEYVMAAAEAMKPEYDAIHRAGFVLQLDCPDLGGGFNRPACRDMTPAQFRAFIAGHVEALNLATRDIPPERMRMHVCWGNYEGPHVRDIPLAEILEVLLTARPAALSVEGANGRHEHEWALLAERPLPEGKVIVPGVIDSTTNFVEHPELVAQRIVRYAEVAGRENVIASTDCGFASLAHGTGVHPEIAWAKLASLSEGARLASERLWR